MWRLFKVQIRRGLVGSCYGYRCPVYVHPFFRSEASQRTNESFMVLFYLLPVAASFLWDLSQFILLHCSSLDPKKEVYGSNLAFVCLSNSRWSLLSQVEVLTASPEKCHSTRTAARLHSNVSTCTKTSQLRWFWPHNCTVSHLAFNHPFQHA